MINSDPKIPQDNLQSKIPEHPKEPLAKNLFTHVSNYVDKEAFWAYWTVTPNDP